MKNQKGVVTLQRALHWNCMLQALGSWSKGNKVSCHTGGICDFPQRHEGSWGEYGKGDIPRSNNAGFTAWTRASLRYVRTEYRKAPLKKSFWAAGLHVFSGEGGGENASLCWMICLSEFFLSQKDHLLKVKLRTHHLLPVPKIIPQISVSLSNGLYQPVLPSPWPSNPSAWGPSPCLPTHQCGPSFWWVSAAHGLSFWSPGIEMLSKEKAPGACPAWASTDFLIPLRFYWACTMHSDHCWCKYRFYLFNAAPILHLLQDFSILERSIKYIMSLISVFMVAIMG